jgi:serine protease Do
MQPADPTILKTKETPRRTRPLTYALAALLIFATSFAGGWLGGRAEDGDSGSANVEQQRVVMNSQADLVSEVAKEVGQSVVSVNVTSQSAASDNPYAMLFGLDEGGSTQESAGTGVILSSDGLILTNRHVVPTGTTAVSVTLSDGTVLDNVKVLGRTSSRDSLDIAFLKVEDLKGHTLKAAKIGDSTKMEVGDSVVAIGNALGQFQNTVTTGIISGYGRSVQAASEAGSSLESLDDLFQTDAAINQGNSGGPLVNLSGEVIGINTAIASDSQNVGFAIPINNVKGMIKSVSQKGKLERPYLGVMYVLLTDDIAKQYDLKVTRGAYIPKSAGGGSSSIVADGPAAKAGLEEGDVIAKVDGKAIDDKTSLVSLLSKYSVGDKVTLTLKRGSDTKTISVTLSAAPSN